MSKRKVSVEDTHRFVSQYLLSTKSVSKVYHDSKKRARNP